MKNLKPLTILHSNDLHGDFMAEEIDKDLAGGVSLLSGYVQQQRKEAPNLIYCIAGDMLQGSLIDAEFKGISTIEIMNTLAPDVVTLGNHETDYGLTHLLFLERCARFPIVNANIFIKNPLTRLFTPHKFFKIDGMRIMFIGLITEEVMASIKSDNLISSLINVNDAAAEVGRICNAYRNIDVDFTILLTHIGFEEDKRLAALLDPNWGVDLIIGGHSHTILEEPVKINNILITQAGVGTKHLGRFDIIVNTDSNDVHSFSWQLLDINEKNCPKDEAMELLLSSYKEQTDEKYGHALSRLRRKYTHPSRYQETELGNLFADAFAAQTGVDLMLYGSGSIRTETMQPLVTLGVLLETVPFKGKLHQLIFTGAQLKQVWRHILREETFLSDHTEFFQLSHRLRIAWSRAKQDFECFEYDGKPVIDDATFLVGLQSFHRDNLETSLGITLEEVLANGSEAVIATNEQDVIIEYFSQHSMNRSRVDGRLTVL
ncbi:MAG: bifunctional metallophosphatase/5'-nucleotidase [Coriobacteriales bacterium]|jgi:5'-nucleotidase|nr:bifunctional metallophosphatase/5'-nucleotidase [Coriobacteriales bacterium]